MINVPNEVLCDTHMSAADATAFARKMVALGYYSQNNVSIGYCAEIAGMTEEEFILYERLLEGVEKHSDNLDFQKDFIRMGF